MISQATNLSQLGEELERYLCAYPKEFETVQQIRLAAGTSPGLFSRKEMNGHLTASGIVQKDGQILMLFHPFLKKWLQPGGHLDRDESPCEAAIREVYEETGVACQPSNPHLSSSIPVDIDIHYIPPNPVRGESGHLHYDFRYLLSINPANPPPAFEDAEAIGWKTPSEVGEPNLRRLLAKLPGLA